MKINQWLIWSLLVALQVWANIAWCDPNIKWVTHMPPCQVSDGICAAGQTTATETAKPIAQIRMTAAAVLTDSCTLCGKETR